MSVTLEQAVAMSHCIARLRGQGKRVVWHHNACGCCISVHEDAGEDECPHEGYVIGADGECDWVIT